MQSSCSIKMSSLSHTHPPHTHTPHTHTPKPNMHVFNHFPHQRKWRFVLWSYFPWMKLWMSGTSITNAWSPVFTGMLNSENVSRGEVEYCTWDAHVERSRALYEAMDQGQLLTSYKKKIVFSQRHFHGFDPQDNTILWMECVLSSWKCSFKRNANISFIFVLAFVLLYLGSFLRFY